MKTLTFPNWIGLLSDVQEEFEKKQANVFAALEKLFTLHNTFLAESRFIKSFLFYSCVIFLLYMLTSTKQTFSIRARLYIGMHVFLLIGHSNNIFSEHITNYTITLLQDSA